MFVCVWLYGSLYCLSRSKGNNLQTSGGSQSNAPPHQPPGGCKISHQHLGDQRGQEVPEMVRLKAFLSSGRILINLACPWVLSLQHSAMVQLSTLREALSMLRMIVKEMKKKRREKKSLNSLSPNFLRCQRQAFLQLRLFIVLSRRLISMHRTAALFLQHTHTHTQTFYILYLIPHYKSSSIRNHIF